MNSRIFIAFCDFFKNLISVKDISFVDLIRIFFFHFFHFFFFLMYCVSLLCSCVSALLPESKTRL